MHFADQAIWLEIAEIKCCLITLSILNVETLFCWVNRILNCLANSLLVARISTA